MSGHAGHLTAAPELGRSGGRWRVTLIAKDADVDEPTRWATSPLQVGVFVQRLLERDYSEEHHWGVTVQRMSE